MFSRDVKMHHNWEFLMTEKTEHHLNLEQKICLDGFELCSPYL